MGKCCNIFTLLNTLYVESLEIIYKHPRVVLINLDSCRTNWNIDKFELTLSLYIYIINGKINIHVQQTAI